MAKPFHGAYADTRPLDVFGLQIRILMPAGAAGGGVSLVESRDQANAGPPLHVHHDADEIFHVLEGRYRFLCAGETVDCGPGDTALVPRDSPHTYLCLETGRMLFMLRPGGFEAFFAAVADAGLQVPGDMAEIARLAASYQLDFLGPNPLV